jgi:26S proteasome regulatory subunit N5
VRAQLEKTDFILEQMRLLLDANDYVRTQIMSRKINTRVLTENGFEVMQRFSRQSIVYRCTVPVTVPGHLQWWSEYRFFFLRKVLLVHCGECSAFFFICGGLGLWVLSGTQDLKLRFYNLMIRYHTHSGNYLDIARSYQAIYDTPKVKSDPSLWKPVRGSPFDQANTSQITFRLLHYSFCI